MSGQSQAVADMLSNIGGVSRVQVTAARRVAAQLEPEKIVEVFQALVARRGILHLSGITGVDTGEAIHVIYHVDFGGVVASMFCAVDRDAPSVPSIVSVVPGAKSPERELYDLFGIRVEGNESHTPLVLPDDWPRGQFPLRKDWKPDTEVK